jgi:hypothetical protein
MVLPRVRLAANIVELDCLSRVDAAVSKHGPPKLACLEPNLSVDRSNGQTCAAASATAVPISEGSHSRIDRNLGQSLMSLEAPAR